jgi:hypothetical protein
MGIVLSTASSVSYLQGSELIVKVGSMNETRLSINQATYPILFMLTNIQTSQNNDPTIVSLLINVKPSYKTYRARQSIDLHVGNPCNSLIFKIAEESKNINVMT